MGINFGSSLNDIGIATFLPRKTITAVETPKHKEEKVQVCLSKWESKERVRERE